MDSVRYGMVGGGPDAFIGAVHRKAAALDGELQLVAGAFSSDPEKSRVQGSRLALPSDRVYGSYDEMAEKEAARPIDERIQAVAIVTPNHTHFDIASRFIESGFDVICDKPMTTTLEDAIALRDLVYRHKCVFALTHNYTGYPLVKHARYMVRSGEIGTVRKIVVAYPQGWLATPLEREGQKQAAWRTDPKLAGAGALGDIGSHAENLAHYITGEEIESICADVSTMVDGRRVDDDANVLIHYESGARGILYCSQISIGEENGLRIRIYGTKGALQWRQEEPNTLVVSDLGGPSTVLRAGNDYLSAVAQHNTRLPAGHPEGFIEAFANVYRNAARTIRARHQGVEPEEFALDFPTVDDGVRGVHFIKKALESGRVREWIDARLAMPHHDA